MVLKPVHPPRISSMSLTTPAKAAPNSVPTRRDPGMAAAIAQAKLGLSEGGIPIGACLVGADGKIIGAGRNMRVQKGSATLHVCFVILSCSVVSICSVNRETGLSTRNKCDECYYMRDLRM
jgi:hypothetical protein